MRGGRFFFRDPEFFPDTFPSGPEGPDLLVELIEDLAVGLGGQIGGRHPADRGEDHGVDQTQMGGEIGFFRDTGFLQEQNHQGDKERTDHGDDFTPGVDAPPEPAQEVEQTRTRSDLENDVEGGFGAVKEENQTGGTEEEDQRSNASGHDVVLFRGTLDQETLVEIMDQIGRAPVQVGQNGRRIGGNEASDHQANETRGEKDQHGRVGDVVAQQFGIEVRERFLNIAQLGINQNGTQPDENPRPGTQDVVSDVEEKNRSERVLFGFGGEHTLRDVTAATRFRSRVPHGPPLNGDRHDEDRHGNFEVIGEIGQDGKVVQASRAFKRRQFFHHAVQPSHLG